MANEQNEPARESPLERGVRMLEELGIPSDKAKTIIDNAVRGYESGKEPLADCSPEHAEMIRGIVEKHSANRDYNAPDSEQ